MKRNLAAALGLGLMLSLTAPALAQASDYRLQYGDSLNFSLVGHPELATAAQAIRPDGRISLPLVKEVAVEGSTIPEVTAALTDQYSRYFTNPEVVVSVEKFKRLEITVEGQVYRAGTYDFDQPPSLLDVLAAAGGIGDRGARDHVKVLAPGKPVATFDVDKLLAQPTLIPEVADGTVVEVDEVWYPDFYKIAPVAVSVLTAAAILFRVYP